MFIMGGFSRIRFLFVTALWEVLSEEHWRERFEPLASYPPPRRVQREWESEIVTYPPAAVERLRTGASVWLINFTARRRPEPETVS